MTFSKISKVTELRTTPFDQYFLALDLCTTPIYQYFLGVALFSNILKVRTTPIYQYFLGVGIKLKNALGVVQGFRTHRCGNTHILRDNLYKFL
jgi:hypothetical protein